MRYSTVGPFPLCPTFFFLTWLAVWFEAFPLVYVGIYHFSLGQSGLPFLGLIVSSGFVSMGYIAWNYYYVEPQFRKTMTLVPESRLAVALVASFFIPTSLFIFGACAGLSWVYSSH
jgi:DHA1 family multidrug resistance protein-like MFS transporter